MEKHWYDIWAERCNAEREQAHAQAMKAESETSEFFYSGKRAAYEEVLQMLANMEKNQ